MAAKKIAIIDDEKDITLLLSIELKSSGYDVVTACNGEEGLELVQREKPDLVLLDIMMPRMDGFQMLEALRDDPATKNVFVILLSAMSSVADIQRGLDLGIEDYVVKPFHSELLIKKIKRILS